MKQPKYKIYDDAWVVFDGRFFKTHVIARKFSEASELLPGEDPCFSPYGNLYEDEYVYLIDSIIFWFSADKLISDRQALTDSL